MICPKCGISIPLHMKKCDSCGFDTEGNEAKKLELQAIEDASTNPLYGIKGCLILVAIGVVLSPLVFLYNLYEEAVSMHDESVQIVMQYASFQMTFLANITLEVLFLAASIYMLILFLKKKKKFPLVYVMLSATSSAWTIIVSLLFYICSLSIKADVVSLQDYFEPQDFRQVIITCIWIAYMLKSKRVKATFIH